MSTNSLEGENVFPFDSIFFDDQVDRVIDGILPLFDRKIKKHVLFHLSFVLLGLVEIGCFVYFLATLIQLSLVALSLAVLFLTFFSYFILRLYFESKRPNDILLVKVKFVEACKHLIDYRSHIPEHHLAVANACSKFAATLRGRELLYYRLPKSLDFLGTTMEWFSCYWHWEDIFHMREALLMEAVEEHIELVKLAPTDLEVHASLANAYVTLSSLYINSRHQDHHEEERWVLSENDRKILNQKYRNASERAIEEFKILNDFAPDDPWVHLQLAYSYYDLGMPDEEIREYETVLELCPGDKDILFKLGVLYFQQGQNAKGLEVYEELKGANFKKAEQLIAHYGEY